MARFYEKPNQKVELEGAGLKQLTRSTREAVLGVWIAGAIIAVSAVVFYVLSGSVGESNAAMAGALAASVCALAGLMLLYRSMKGLHLLSPEDVVAHGKVEKFLEQLDDRFAVFESADPAADHIIVGPSGVFAVRSWPGSTEPPVHIVAEVRGHLDEIEKLCLRLIPNAAVEMEPVVCIQPGGVETVKKHARGVWVVPIDKMVPSMLKRSTREGAITSNVEQTGAFSSDQAQTAAIEKALADHWAMSPRKTMDDYRPPSHLTK